MAPPCLQDDPTGKGGGGSPSSTPTRTSSPTSVTNANSAGTLRQRHQKKQIQLQPQLNQQPLLLEEKEIAPAVLSANIVFYPPSQRYWRINQQWYDLTGLDHPGGKQILELARDRFEDATFAFEAHHYQYEKARKVLQKYLLPPDQQLIAEQESRRRPTPMEHSQSGASFINDPHYDAQLLDPNYQFPAFLPHDAFYSVLRRRVARYLASVGCPHGEPTWECVVLFWTTFLLWLGLLTVLYMTGYALLTVPLAFVSAVLGSFGHNWVHQPRYKHWGWALLSLDTVGFSSEGWYRDHVLHHHMYTNTPWDHHFYGTDPFVKTDPTAPRNWYHKHLAPKLFHVILSFGTYGNFAIHAIHLLQGQEVWSIGKLFLIVEHVLFYQKWGLHGILLMMAMQAMLANYYFTMALMNHNAEHCLDVTKRNQARDWGQAQLISSADWSVHLSFRQSIIYLWLNFHTVHHLFPKVDYSHHAEIHKILETTCKEFKVDYIHSNPVTIYKQMIHSFSTPLSFMQEVMVYAGGI